MIRNIKNVFGAASLAAILAAPGAFSAPPADSLDGAVSSAITATNIKTKLIEKLGNDALHISVSVLGDKATLSGSVEKKATQELAKEVALSVKGIKDVDNQLSERTPEKVTTAAKDEVKDALLESKVKNILLTEVGSNALKIEVEATDGVVSLRGTLANPDLVKSAIQKTRAIKGVKKVVNLLTS